MSPTSERVHWVIGRGLLGSAVGTASTSDAIIQPIRWGDPEAARADLAAGIAQLVGATEGPLAVFWCAGKGVTSTPEDQLEQELDTFRAFLDLLSGLSPTHRERLSLFLASSVGGAYAGSAEGPYTEFTVPVPLSAYGRTKLRMEKALTDATARGGWRSLIARITNLYGAGQDMGKGQGLLSVLVASYVTRRPATVFASLDTLRDYIYVDDCARVVVAGMDRVAQEPPGTVVVKIVGAMSAQSVGAILSEIRRLNAGRHAPIGLGQGPSTGQALDLRVRSHVWTDLDALVQTTLPEGLHRLRIAQLRAHASTPTRR